MDFSKWKLAWKDITPTQVAEAMGELMKEHLDPIKARVDALEKSDEQKAYRGVFSGAESYQKHNSVTHQGGVWIATRDDPGVPGIDGNGWRLAVKRGKDGRGAS
jgi:hypothetical protein